MIFVGNSVPGWRNGNFKSLRLECAWHVWGITESPKDGGAYDVVKECLLKWGNVGNK